MYTYSGKQHNIYFPTFVTHKKELLLNNLNSNEQCFVVACKVKYIIIKIAAEWMTSELYNNRTKLQNMLYIYCTQSISIIRICGLHHYSACVRSLRMTSSLNGRRRPRRPHTMSSSSRPDGWSVRPPRTCSSFRGTPA